MKVILTAAEGQTSSERMRVAVRASRSLLLVDDDPRVGKSLARSLGTRFDVEVASGVKEARAELAKRQFDIILSDVQMPDGGGRCLYEELAASAPEIAQRLILFTGGAPSDSDRAFVEEHRIVLLSKPLEIDAFLEAANAISPPALTAADIRLPRNT